MPKLDFTANPHLKSLGGGTQRLFYQREKRFPEAEYRAECRREERQERERKELEIRFNKMVKNKSRRKIKIF